MRIRTAIVASLLVAGGCFQSPIEREAEDIRDDALVLAQQTAELDPEAPPESQLVQRARVADARQALVHELQEMTQVLANQQSRATTPEAQRAMFALQQRYESLARQLETAGTDPAALAEIQEDVAELDADVMAFGYGLGT